MSDAFIIGLSVALLASAAIYIFIAYVARSKSSLLATYLYGGSGLSDHQVFGTIYASGLSFATVIVALLQLGVYFGLALSWAILTYCVGWVVFIRFSARIRDVMKPHETIHTFLGRRYSSVFLRRFCSVATIIGFVGSFAIEILAIHVILGTFVEGYSIKYIIITIVAAATILYAVIGGFPAVIKTDRYQSYMIVITISVILLLSILYRRSVGIGGIVDPESLQKLTLPIQLAISLFLINVAFPVVDMSAWQRAKAASSTLALRKGAVFAVIFFLLTWSMLLFSSMTVTGILPDQQEPIVAILGFAGTMEGVAGFVVGFILLMGLLAAMFSTADTFLNAAATTLFIDQNNLAPSDSSHNDGQQQSSSRNLKIATALLGTTGFLVCLVLNHIGFGIVALIFALYGGTLALFPSVLVALKSNDSINLKSLKPWALISVIVGFVSSWLVGIYGVVCSAGKQSVCEAFSIYLAPDPYQAPTYAFALSSSIMIIGWLYTLRQRRANTGSTIQ